MSHTDYWEETLSSAADECNLILTSEQLTHLAKAVEISHENYGMAFYSPSPRDFYAELERKYEEKLKAKQAEFELYQRKAEEAVRVALRQHSDASISIGKRGEVFRYGGRTEQIQ